MLIQFFLDVSLQCRFSADCTTQCKVAYFPTQQCVQLCVSQQKKQAQWVPATQRVTTLQRGRAQAVTRAELQLEWLDGCAATESVCTFKVNTPSQAAMDKMCKLVELKSAHLRGLLPSAERLFQSETEFPKRPGLKRCANVTFTKTVLLCNGTKDIRSQLAVACENAQWTGFEQKLGKYWLEVQKCLPSYKGTTTLRLTLLFFFLKEISLESNIQRSVLRRCKSNVRVQ